MAPRLQVFLIVISLSFMIYIFALVRREELELKYTLAWCFLGVTLVIIAIKPSLVLLLTKVLGMQLPVNTVFLTGIFCIMVIVLTLTVAISRTSVRTKRLIQELALVKGELSRMENRLREKSEVDE